MVDTSLIQLVGAACFGAIIGWYVYFINRYRKADIQWSDLATLIGIIGGAAITRLFGESTDLFGAYGIGLAVGFFAYFLTLIILVHVSKENFGYDWFLDGRRKTPPSGWSIPPGTAVTVVAMEAKTEGKAGDSSHQPGG
jgi:hypothetical protein